jgi:hypothetical protein
LTLVVVEEEGTRAAAVDGRAIITKAVAAHGSNIINITTRRIIMLTQSQNFLPSKTVQIELRQ